MQNNRKQLLIAAEAARIIATEGQSHYGTAKRKAAARLGNAKSKYLPSNQQIEDALKQYQQFYGGADHHLRQIDLLTATLNAMQFFSAFNPKLVGATLEGTAEAHQRITLHVFTEDADSIIHHLLKHHIAFEQQQRKIRWHDNNYRQVEFIVFVRDELEFELLVFPLRAPAPPCPISGKSQERASKAEVELRLEKLKQTQRLDAFFA